MEEARHENLNGKTTNGRDFEIISEKLLKESPSFRDRRRYPRINHSLPVQFKQLSRPSELFSGTLTEDISGGGVRLLADDFLAPQTKLLLSFSVGESISQVRTVARIIWINKKAYYDKYALGVEFIEIPEEQRRQIITFVRQNLP